jgi:hypothetical protein
MRKVFAIVLAAGVFAFVLGLASCGDLDPSKAHPNVTITFENQDETISDGCGSGVACNNAGVWDYRWVEVLVTENGERTGATTAPDTDAPVTDVEISFMTWPVENDKLYLVTDNRSALPPLVQPYTMRTDERGRAELVWMFQYPSLCSGDEVTHWLEATVGTNRSRMTVGITCQAATGDEGETD